jgi:hypothetical protein
MNYPKHIAQASQETAPRTQMEQFVAQQGTVIISGYTLVGQIDGTYGGLAAVNSMEYVDPASGRKELGIAIDCQGSEWIGARG